MFPETWTQMKDGDFMELVKVDANSTEYQEVVTDFHARRGRHAPCTVKVS